MALGGNFAWTRSPECYGGGQMCSTADNREQLLERFFQRLRALAPRSVLDVGCGNGRLLELCRDAGIPAEGIEADSQKVRELTDRGLTVREGDAAALPGDDRSFDWVALRHVLHHLANVAVALDEACRVAKTGLLLAEPWFDTSIPSQALALRIDRWIKHQHQRTGRVHEEALDTNQVMALLPVDQDFEIESEHYLRLRERPLEDLQTETAPLLEGPEQAEYERLEAEALKNGLTYGGTMILCLRRRN